MILEEFGASVDPDALVVLIVHYLRAHGVKGVHVRLDWSAKTDTVIAIEVRAHLPLRPAETYHAKTYARIPCDAVRMDQAACALIERALGGKE